VSTGDGTGSNEMSCVPATSATWASFTGSTAITASSSSALDGLRYVSGQANARTGNTPWGPSPSW
jgi:hypothetical protein